MLTISEITFAQIEARFGEITAYAHLEEIERASGLAPKKMTGIDPELRMTHACRLQDAKNKTYKDSSSNHNTMLEAA
jgi:hypothetical protein